MFERFGNSHIIQLNEDNQKRARWALNWFAELYVQWCGISVYRDWRWLSASEFFGCSSDASPIGGGFTTKDEYALWKWCTCGCASTDNIMRLELATMLIGLVTRMAVKFSGLLVIWTTDTGSGVSAFNKGYADDDISSDIIAEARQILISSQTDNFRLVHVPRKRVVNADLLTRGDDAEFLAREGNSTRRRITPYTTRTVKRLEKGTKESPAVYGFSSHH
jgi:hypothetical protein